MEIMDTHLMRMAMMGIRQVIVGMGQNWMLVEVRVPADYSVRMFVAMMPVCMQMQVVMGESFMCVRMSVGF
jgi:hypothetical protein